MNSYQTKLLKIWGISGIYYFTKKRSQTLVIYGSGAPVVPDNGTLSDSPFIMQYDCDLFVPDYIGFGRSDGVFTPKNCLKTFLTLFKCFTKGCYGYNSSLKEKFYLKYDRIIFIGRSLGGTYVPILPLFDNKITELGLIFPAVDNPSSGSIEGEETNEDFMRAMGSDGYKNLYRGILSRGWWRHLRGEDGLSPMDNISCLSNAKLFLGHGKKDKCIHYSKSQKYFDQIIQVFPKKRGHFKLMLYENGGHDQITSNRACHDILKWFGIKKRAN